MSGYINDYIDGVLETVKLLRNYTSEVIIANVYEEEAFRLAVIHFQNTGWYKQPNSNWVIFEYEPRIVT